LTPREALHQYWGYSQFRSPQEEVIASFLKKHDVLAILPTGAGKSVCFQVSSLVSEGICLVVTPLIALMQDQVNQLKSKGIPAVAIHSGMSHQEIDIALDNCVYGKQKFLYVSPERLLTEIFIERFKKMKVNLVAIDEAHCISQWGYDFRPPYLQIAELRKWQPGVPFMALTASATQQVKEDIIEKLELKSPEVFQKSFARDNLSFVVRRTERKEKQLLEILCKVQGSAIVYVRSRKATETLSKLLTRNQINSTYYHAGLTHEDRQFRQREWIENRARVMVATNAFGMGINKADVRTVIHMDIPETVEAYYQEAGRAGRDGRRSYAVVIFHEVDALALRNKTIQSQPTIEYLKKIYQALANFYQLALGSSQAEAFDFDLEQFCKRYNFKTSAVYPALKKLEECGLIQLSESFYRPSRVHFLYDRTKIYEFQVAHAQFDPVIKSLLRLFGAELFSEFVPISEIQLAKSLKSNVKDVQEFLHRLHLQQVISYEKASDAPQITFVLPRQDADYLPIDRKHLEARRDLIISKMESMINYVEQDQVCRMRMIQEYFNETTYKDCNLCDVCIAKRKNESGAMLTDYQEQILYLLTQKPMNVDDLEVAVAPHDKELFIDAVRELVDNATIAYDDVWVLRKKS
jgi:ATP-dependent DNA helicase RecQ